MLLPDQTRVVFSVGDCRRPCTKELYNIKVDIATIRNESNAREQFSLLNQSKNVGDSDIKGHKSKFGTV